MKQKIVANFILAFCILTGCDNSDNETYEKNTAISSKENVEAESLQVEKEEVTTESEWDTKLNLELASDLVYESSGGVGTYLKEFEEAIVDKFWELNGGGMKLFSNGIITYYNESDYDDDGYKSISVEGEFDVYSQFELDKDYVGESYYENGHYISHVRFKGTYPDGSIVFDNEGRIEF